MDQHDQCLFWISSELLMYMLFVICHNLSIDSTSSGHQSHSWRRSIFRYSHIHIAAHIGFDSKSTSTTKKSNRKLSKWWPISWSLLICPISQAVIKVKIYAIFCAAQSVDWSINFIFIYQIVSTVKKQNKSNSKPSSVTAGECCLFTICIFRKNSRDHLSCMKIKYDIHVNGFYWPAHMMHMQTSYIHLLLTNRRTWKPYGTTQNGNDGTHWDSSNFDRWKKRINFFSFAFSLAISPGRTMRSTHT